MRIDLEGRSRPVAALRRALPVAALLLVLAAPARADRRELYLEVSGGPVRWPALVDPEDGTATSRQVKAGGGGVALYYGLDDTWHVGAALHLSVKPNAYFPFATINGTDAQGPLWEDVWAGSAGGLLRYRVNTGLPVAPVLQLEALAALNAFTRIQMWPVDQTFLGGRPPVVELRLAARATALLEWRIREDLVASLGFAAGHTFASRLPWEFELPLSVGWVW